MWWGLAALVKATYQFNVTSPCAEISLQARFPTLPTQAGRVKKTLAPLQTVATYANKRVIGVPSL
ncbi:hypothetical protein GCM10023156_35930 [Novipirellula rosea]|uniref:Uncharacterized protein n=1 Tax=Novipirellula rosea TaxID=1031540 RepID=A0ABP8N192_9BACT